jgi:hypothetical protein
MEMISPEFKQVGYDPQNFGATTLHQGMNKFHEKFFDRRNGVSSDDSGKKTGKTNGKKVLNFLDMKQLDGDTSLLSGKVNGREIT